MRSAIGAAGSPAIRWMAVGAVLLAAAGVSCRSPVPPDRRSVILITLDTTRADHLGAYGGDTVPTPNLDALASRGALMETAISQVPLTLPAHSSILTGRYPSSTGVHHNGIYRLPEGTETLATRLKREGFDTGAFVSAYVLNRGFGVEQGFGTFNDVPVNRFEGGRDQLFEAQRPAEATNAEVFRWLDAHGSNRFFLWVHYYDPHEPYDPPNRKNLAGEGYDREISYLDSCVGDLVRRLDRDDLVNRSILVVTGDHGESLGEHGERTHGLFLYEGAVHVPMFVIAPGLVKAGERVQGPVELVDIQPTIMDLLGWDPLPDTQGESLLPRIRHEETGPLPPAFAETLMPRIEFGWSELFMIRGPRFKYIEAPTPELYDLREDPGEMANLAPNDPERAGEMAAVLAGWRSGPEIDQSDGKAVRSLTRDEEKTLRSLGYLSGGAYKTKNTSGRLPDPKDMIAELRRLDRARNRLEEGATEEALSMVDRILRRNPNNYQARVTRIMALVDLERYPEAEKEARAGLALAALGGDSEDGRESGLQGLLASVMMLEKRYDEAEALYRRMLQDDPMDELVEVDLARLLVETGRSEEALTRLDSILERNPKEGMALAVRFQAERSLGRKEAMLATAATLAEARAGDAATLEAAGDLLIQNGDASRAAVCYEIAQEQIPDLVPALLLKLGKARARSGEVEAAMEIFRACSRLLPRDPRPTYYMGRLEETRGDLDAARTLYREALRRNPSFAPAAQSLRGLIHPSR